MNPALGLILRRIVRDLFALAEPGPPPDDEPLTVTVTITVEDQ